MANMRKAEGPATILAIGTANPGNIYYQEDYPDFYFRVTNSDSMTHLKEKFKRICEKTMIRKRHLHITEEILKKNSQMCVYGAPALNARQDILISEVPKLGVEAALNAIKEWGLPKSNITHIIFNSTSGVDMPGADFRIVQLLGLKPTIKRVMMYQQGCYISGTLLRIAKDIAENNFGARVLLVSSEISLGAFHGPCEADIESLIGQAFIGDGASALIIGADPDTSKEKPLFELVSTYETIIPKTSGAIEGPLREMGLEIHMSKMVPMLISDNVEKCLLEAFSPFGVSDWNSLFWIVHPGGRLILDNIEAKLGLKQEKLEATRCMLAEYGNMTSASVFFILDEVRRRSVKEGKGTTGLGSEWGVLLAFGSGLTIDIVVLRSYPCIG